MKFFLLLLGVIYVLAEEAKNPEVNFELDSTLEEVDDDIVNQEMEESRNMKLEGQKDPGGNELINLRVSSILDSHHMPMMGWRGGSHSSKWFYCSRDEHNPWMILHVRPKTYYSIELGVRGDSCCAHRFKNIEIRAGTQSGLGNNVVAHFWGPGHQGRRYVLQFNKPVYSTYISIQKKEYSTLEINGIRLNQGACRHGYSGADCAQENECITQSPCKNGATCVDSHNGYTCSCKSGFIGKKCEQVNVCISRSPCKNGASCEISNGGYKCTCQNGFSGNNCEEENECVTKNPCKNGATCEKLQNGYKCKCKNGFSGEKCEKLNICIAERPCKNGASCEISGYWYKCICKSGFSGKNCEQENECVSKMPCKNGATCEKLKCGYKCKCKNGFSGENCEEENECVTKNPCKNGATCEKLQIGYTCKCKNGFSGSNCEKAPVKKKVRWIKNEVCQNPFTERTCERYAKRKGITMQKVTSTRLGYGCNIRVYKKKNSKRLSIKEIIFNTENAGTECGNDDTRCVCYSH